MGLSLLDGAIIFVYLAGVTVAGTLIAGRQKTSREFFLGGRQLAWWAVGLSLVAGETSTLTFISIPGLAYTSDMRFLQLAFGYVIGRLLVSVLFIPSYYRGDLETAYDFLGKRFGLSLRRFTSMVFLLTRVLASGVRLFATAIPVHLISGFSYATCIILIGGATIIYTSLGGLKAVVAMDVVQLVVYLGGAVVSMALILHSLPHGWQDVTAIAVHDGVNKFAVLHSSSGRGVMEFLATPYTLAGGLVGGTFLSMASHGTDQLLVQRLLGCRTARDSQKALMLDAFCIVIQFAFFLLLGVCLFAFYHGASLQSLGLASSDEIFPRFIVGQLPRGLLGLLIAAVLASAMGTLSSSISSLASSTYLDIFRMPAVPAEGNERRSMRTSRVMTVFWGAALIGGAMLFTDTRNPVVELGLTIASFTYGGMLGTFLLGLFFAKTRESDAYVGFLTGCAVMTCVVLASPIDYTWHTVIGCAATIAAGCLSLGIRSLRRSRQAPSDRS